MRESGIRTIAVGDQHDVLVGHGILERVVDLVPEAAVRVLVVHPDALPGPGERVAAAIAATGREVIVRGIPDNEAAKEVTVAADLWSVLGQAGFTRTDAVVAVGGGTVTDLAGFVAAAWLRGVPVVHVPTTLLAMVDAAVGGKTGINTPEGKNLVGAFHTPAGVLCDLDLLATLPTADLRAGLAEVIKAGFIVDSVILDLVEADPAGATRHDGPHLDELVERAIRVKADVVAADLRESWLREILNYGHTLGHAVEQVEHYRRRHGEAVAIGMVYAAELSHAAGLLDAAVVARHRGILNAVGLPTGYPDGDWSALRTAMGRDKKTRGATVRFVVLEDIAKVTRLAGPSEDLLEQAYRAIAGRD